MRRVEMVALLNKWWTETVGSEAKVTFDVSGTWDMNHQITNSFTLVVTMTNAGAAMESVDGVGNLWEWLIDSSFPLWDWGYQMLAKPDADGGGVDPSVGLVFNEAAEVVMAIYCKTPQA